MKPAAVIAFIFVFVAGAGVISGNVPQGLDKEAKEAYETIRTSKSFCDVAVGVAGRTPDEVLAFRLLIKEKDPKIIFRALFKDSEFPGQLYALCGLFHCDHEYFKKVVEPYRNSNEQVETMIGCNVSKSTVASVVESSSPDVIRLKKPSQTTREWAEETSTDIMTRDIFGGGWANVFWERDGYGTEID
jgi:hypothetical protein